MSWLSTWLRRRKTETDEEPPNLRAAFVAGFRGRGIEIGALATPLWLPEGASVTFVDRFDQEALRAHNPDVPADRIVRPDVICDAMSLDGLPDASCDFLIACHLLEHVHDPIRALLAWHRVLKPDGLALCIVPDARFTFDRGRPLTSIEHLLWDFTNAGTELKVLADLAHIAECNLNMHETLDVDGAVDLARRILRESYDTHFHVWTYESLRAQLGELIRDYGLPFALRRSACDEVCEMLFLLERKTAGHGRLNEVDSLAPRARR